MSEKTFYITTPIYYINATPSIGHAYTTMAADARARFERLRGRKVYFLTGTDEHGAKVARAARDAGLSPQEHADKISAQFRECWDALHISYDDYIRTTEPRHERVAQQIIQKLWDGGHLRLGSYSGWYSVPDETFSVPRIPLSVTVSITSRSPLKISRGRLWSGWKRLRTFSLCRLSRTN
jgi:methionyl-tRNA synthetase